MQKTLLSCFSFQLSRWLVGYNTRPRIMALPRNNAFRVFGVVVGYSSAAYWFLSIFSFKYIVKKWLNSCISTVPEYHDVPICYCIYKTIFVEKTNLFKPYIARWGKQITKKLKRIFAKQVLYRNSCNLLCLQYAKEPDMI